jgi:hypothetical protein
LTLGVTCEIFIRRALLETQDEQLAQNKEEVPTNRFYAVIREVWQGQRSLAQTFWGWHVLFNVLLVQNLGGFMIVMLVGDDYVNSVALLYMVLVWIPVWIWVIVGLWRSATNNPGFWAVVVKILVVIAIVLQFAPLAMLIVR